MFEKIKKMFETKEKRVENLVSLLIILIITLIVINKILDDENELTENIDYKNETGVELAQTEMISNDLEKRLEKSLSEILGVGNVSVLLTYKDDGLINPIYNLNSSITTTEENDGLGNSKISKSECLQKEVITKNDEDIILEKRSMPILEGAIIVATRCKRCKCEK